MRIITIIFCISISISAKSQVVPIRNIWYLVQQIAEKERATVAVDSIISYGMTLIGHRYRYGGSSLAGFDCSGLIRFIFRKYGYSLPHSSREYAKLGKVISKDSIKSLQKGDILLFKGRNTKSSRIGHISIVIEATENKILMLHSCCDKGVAIENYLTSEYYLKRLMAIRRISTL